VQADQLGTAHSITLHGRETRVETFAQPEGYKLVIGRDMSDIVSLRSTILETLLWGDLCAVSLFLIGVLTLSVRQARRMHVLSKITEAIAHGAIPVITKVN